MKRFSRWIEPIQKGNAMDQRCPAPAACSAVIPIWRKRARLAPGGVELPVTGMEEFDDEPLEQCFSFAPVWRGFTG